MYLELLMVTILISKLVFDFFLSMILSVVFNVIDYKVDAVRIYEDIPETIIYMVTMKYLIVQNTINNPNASTFLYYLGGALILFIAKIIYQRNLYELAYKEGDPILQHNARRFYRVIYWVYLIFLITLVYVDVDLNNPISNFYINIIAWVSHINYVGWLFTYVAGLLLLGSFYYSLIFIFQLIFKRRYA